MTFFARRAWLSTLLFAALSATAACSSTGAAPDGTDGTRSAGGGAPATLAAVQAIFDAHCTGCHDASAQGLPADPSLSLVDGDSHAALVGTPADEACGGIRVVPGSPDTSYLMSKIGPGTPCSGQHMPRAFEIGPRFELDDADLATIRAWIAAGAAP